MTNKTGDIRRGSRLRACAAATLIAMAVTGAITGAEARDPARDPARNPSVPPAAEQPPAGPKMPGMTVDEAAGQKPGMRPGDTVERRPGDEPGQMTIYRGGQKTTIDTEPGADGVRREITIGHHVEPAASLMRNRQNRRLWLLVI